MKINKYLVMAILLISVFAFVASSQVSQEATSITTDAIQDCNVDYYNSTENVYGNVSRVRPTYGKCFNSLNQSYNSCINGTESYQSYEPIGTATFLRNTSQCNTKSFVVSLAKGSQVVKKEVDFSRWGVCVQEQEDNCVAILCGTLEGGSARNGIFNGCDGGKSCQKFLFCPAGIKVLYKASRYEFVEDDPTFYLSKLELKGVAK